VQASLGAAQAEYRGLQLALVSRHQHVQRAEIVGFQFQAVHRGLLNGRNAETERRRRRGGQRAPGATAAAETATRRAVFGRFGAGVTSPAGRLAIRLLLEPAPDAAQLAQIAKTAFRAPNTVGRAH
jgi:hypothetical protein